MSTETENELPTLEEATKRLEDLREEINSSNPAKHGIPENIRRLTPSENQKKIKFFSGVRINKGIKDKFRQYQVTGTCRLKFETKNRGQTGSGVKVGKKWHTSIRNYLQFLENPKQESDEEGEAVIKGLKSKESIVRNIEFLQSEFPLYGFMTEEENSEINFWNGKADAIGWLEGKYVIVDWKAVDLLNFWENKPLPYGDYLHQCLVYARLLQLHLELEELPYILIVPISNITGNDIRPALFRDFPKECKEKIEHYEWSKELKFLEIDVAETLVDEESFTVPDDGVVPYEWSKELKFLEIDVAETLVDEESFTVPDDGVVPDEARVIDVFKENVTVRELLEALGLNLSKLKVA